MKAYYTARHYLRAGHYAFMDMISTPNPNAIFVVGNQKSGTTAIGWLLATAVGLSQTSDFRVTSSYPEEFSSLYAGNMELDTFVRRHHYEFSKQVVKEPSLTFIADQLQEFFPKSRTIFIVRDPRENIRSIFNRLMIDGRSLKLVKPDIINPAWADVLINRGMQLPQGTIIERMCHRWNRAVEIGCSIENALLVRYEDFLKDKLQFIEALAVNLGLKCKNNVRPFLDNQFQPKGQTISAKNFFGREHLLMIENLCSESMRKLGYLDIIGPK